MCWLDEAIILTAVVPGEEICRCAVDFICRAVASA